MNSLLNKDIISILSESADLDNATLESMEDRMDDAITDMILSDDLSDLYDDCEELDDDIEYTEEMVNVIQQQSQYINRYLIEYNDLYRYMKSANCNAKQAVINVCEANRIPMNSTFIVLESEESIKESIHEAKCGAKKAKDPKVKEKIVKKLKDAKKEVKDLKDNGLKLLKKKK